MNWSDFLSFRQMVTPVVIQVIFWLGVAGSVIAGLAALANDSPFGGLILIVVGPLLVRVYCELLIVIFKIHDSLRRIEQNTSTSPTGATPGPSPSAPPTA